MEAYGQRLASRHSQGTASQLYWSLGAARFFNHAVLDEHDSIVICETPFQALVFLANGVPNAVSPVGRWGFNEVQSDALDRARPQCVVVAYDDGPDAQRAAKLIEQAVSALGIPVMQHPVAQRSRPRRPPPPVEPDTIQSVVAQLHYRSGHEAGRRGVRV